MTDFGRFAMQSKPSPEPIKVALSLGLSGPTPEQWFDESGRFGDPEWQQNVNKLVAKVIQMREALIAGAVEAARITGTHGVLVKGNTISVTLEVPYGEIHYQDEQPPRLPCEPVPFD